MSAESSEKQALAILKLSSKSAAAKLDDMSPEQQLELVLSIPDGRRRMDLVLLASRSQELMQVMPPEDMVLTIKDIGDHDALPLLELSSDTQLTYLFDLELWIKAGMDLQKLTHWLWLLFECGQERILRWLRSVDFEQLVLLLERTLFPVQRDEIESLPEMVSARIVTPDDTHFYVVKLGVDYSLLKNLLDLIFAEEREMFFALTANLVTVAPAELEEQALRWRNGRLADRGWPDLQEAHELYRPKDPKTIKAEGKPPFGLDNPPHYPLQARYVGHIFKKGMALLEQNTSQRVASQLANLINRVMIADSLTLTDIESLEKAASRVKGHLEIGLFSLGAQDQESCARTLRGVPLLTLFQVAHGAIQKRVQRAKLLLKSPSGSLITMLGTPLEEKISALIGPRPLFFPADSTTAREFADTQELTWLDRDLDLVEAIFTLCQGLGLAKNSLPDPFPPESYPETPEGLSVYTLLLTAFSNNRLGLQPHFAPFPLNRLSDLLSELARDKSHLLETIREWSLSLVQTIPPGFDLLVEKLAHLLSNQVLFHDPGHLDPRFVEGLWIRRQVND